MVTLGLLASNMPVESPNKRAWWFLERSGDTERERDASDEDDSSMEDWAERAARAAVRRWAGERSLKRGSSHTEKAGGGGGEKDREEGGRD